MFTDCPILVMSLVQDKAYYNYYANLEATSYLSLNFKLVNSFNETFLGLPDVFFSCLDSLATSQLKLSLDYFV